MLVACVGSILSQSYPSFEIIVVDQAPEPVLKETLGHRLGSDSRILYVHAASAGAARARNIGIANAQGSIVAFIDDDAVAAPCWLQGVAAALMDESSPALMAGRILPLWSGDRPPWYPKRLEYLLGLYDIGEGRCRLPEGDLPFGANMAGLRNVIVEHGGFDERMGFNYFRKDKRRMGGEETVLGIRIRDSGHALVYEPTAVVKHHVAAHKQTRRYFLKRNFWEGVTVIEEMNVLGRIHRRGAYYCSHAREICMAFARFLFPRHRNTYAEPDSVIRMLSLSRIAYSFGVWYGLLTLRTELSGTKSKCASA
jgi:glycosyltransferase involved in cell wall biosynthesis